MCPVQFQEPLQLCYSEVFQCGYKQLVVVQCEEGLMGFHWEIHGCFIEVFICKKKKKKLAATTVQKHHVCAKPGQWFSNLSNHEDPIFL